MNPPLLDPLTFSLIRFKQFIEFTSNGPKKVVKSVDVSGKKELGIKHSEDFFRDES